MTAELKPQAGAVTHLRALSRDMPLVRERALLEFVSEMSDVEVQNDARGKDRFFRRLWRGARGSDRAEQVEITGKILGTQRTVEHWVRELSEQHALSDLAIAQMADHLRKLQLSQAHTLNVTEQARSQVADLASLVGKLASEVDARLKGHDERLDEHDERLAGVEQRLLAAELWQAAQAGFDRAVRRWENTRVYRSVEWAYQVALLSREVATGPCGVHEFVTGNAQWRSQLIERILADPRATAWHGTVALDDVLESASRALPDDDQRAIIAGLLGSGLPDGLRPPAGPLSTALMLTMEYAARPLEGGLDRPESFAAKAVDEVLLVQGRHMPTSYTVREYVRHLVNEQGDGAVEALRVVHDRSAATADG